RVIYANPAANEAAELRDGLAITSGQLSLISLKDQAEFVNVLEQVAAHRRPAFRRLEVKRPSGKLPWLLLLMPVPCSGVSVLIVDREARPELDPAILRELFSLTPAE